MGASRQADCMKNYLEFEDQIADLEGRIAELQAVASNGDTESIDQEIGKLEAKARKTLDDLYNKLDPWQKAQVARHPERPHCLRR